MVFVFSGTAYITNLISVPTSMGDLAWVDTPITDFTLFASAGRFCSNWYSITDFTMFAMTAFKFKFHFSCSFPFISHDTYIVAFIAVATSLINIFIFVAAFIDHGWFLLSVDFTWVDTSMAHIISAAHCTFRLILSLTTSFHSLLTYVHRRFNLIYYFYHQFHLINHFHRRLDFSCRLYHRFHFIPYFCCRCYFIWYFQWTYNLICYNYRSCHKISVPNSLGNFIRQISIHFLLATALHRKFHLGCDFHHRFHYL